MRRTLAALVLAFLVIAVPFYMTAQTTGSGSGTQESAHPEATSGQYETDDKQAGFDFGWLGLLGLAGLLGLRHTHRTDVPTR